MGHVFQPIRQVPQNMKGDGWTCSGQLVDHAGVAEFLCQVGRCGRLHEFAEPGPGIGKTPGGQLNFEMIERPPNGTFHVLCHRPLYPRNQFAWLSSGVRDRWGKRLQ